MNSIPVEGDETGTRDAVSLTFAVLAVAVHLAVSAGAQFGLFRDELYYIACANHPATGYVDHPPLSIWVLGAWKAVFGDSLFSIRVLPALCAGTTTFIAGTLAHRIVFTSERSGDLELWTCDLAGGDLRQVTDELGYDGGAFFSHDGTQLVFRSTHFIEPGPDGSLIGTREQYADILAKHKIRPHRLDLYVCDVDGSNRKQVSDLGGASWAPYFFPGDRRILFSTNHHDPNVPQVEFDLFAVDVDGGNLERITTYKGFDSFPMFSSDGRWLVFGSNRGGLKPGDTNIYIAQWR